MTPEWFYELAGERKGPVSFDELKGLVREGAVTRESLVWREGLTDWAPAARVKGLFSVPPVLPGSRKDPVAHQTPQSVSGPVRTPGVPDAVGARTPAGRPSGSQGLLDAAKAHVDGWVDWLKHEAKPHQKVLVGIIASLFVLCVIGYLTGDENDARATRSPSPPAVVPPPAQPQMAAPEQEPEDLSAIGGLSAEEVKQQERMIEQERRRVEQARKLANKWRDAYAPQPDTNGGGVVPGR